MTLIQLKYFQVICKHNNITRASAELHVSQPSLSNAIKDLEAEFGVSLFNRRSRGLELTEEGRFFLEEANKLLASADRLTNHMKELGNSNQTITLGLPAMSGSLVFADLLQALYAYSPATHIQVIESGSLANRRKVMEHTLDAAIITRNSPLSSGYGHIALRRVNICLYVSAGHSLASKDSIELHDLNDLPLALLPEDTFLTDCIRQYYHDKNLSLHTILHTNQLATIQQLVAKNTVATFLLDGVLEGNNDIVKFSVPNLPPTEIDLIWKSGRQLSAGLRALIAAAKTI